MIDIYFAQLEQIFHQFPTIRTSTLKKKIYNAKQGFINGSITFENDSRLDFVEVKDTEQPVKIKYRYQYMDANHDMIFRYDNAPHHQHLRTFPHHKHVQGREQESEEPTLEDVLLEIAQRERKTI